MTERIVSYYPGAPVPQARHWQEKVLVILAAVALGVVIGPAPVFALSLVSGRSVSLKSLLLIWVASDAGGLISIAISPHQPHAVPGSAGMGVSVLLAAVIWWWKRKRPDKAARALGYKARVRIADLVRTLRESARPRPVLAPGGAL